MGIPNSECDDGEVIFCVLKTIFLVYTYCECFLLPSFSFLKVNLHRDFDPSNTDHTKMYTCLEASSYKPKTSLEPIETIHEVPKFYTPVHKCMNETITYDQGIPTLGYHRPLYVSK